MAAAQQQTPDLALEWPTTAVAKTSESEPIAFIGFNNSLYGQEKMQIQPQRLPLFPLSNHYCEHPDFPATRASRETRFVPMKPTQNQRPTDDLLPCLTLPLRNKNAALDLLNHNGRTVSADLRECIDLPAHNQPLYCIRAHAARSPHSDQTSLQ